MFFDEYGKRDKPTIIMLHGAFFVDTYVRQYALAERYHLVVPHIKGFGRAADEVFVTEEAVAELVTLIKDDAPAYLVGFSFGAQIGFKLVAEHPDLIQKAILISPWLVNKDVIPEKMMTGNLKMLARLKHKFVCRMIGISSGMPRQKVREMTEAMQRVSEQTVRNCVDNGISLGTVRGFETCCVPVMAIAGEREPEDIQNSVKSMAARNGSCTCQLWPKAKHNIPTLFGKQLNQTIEAFFAEEGPVS